jgi:hypothetical protein
MMVADRANGKNQANFSEASYGPEQQDPPHYTVRGFRNDGHAYHMLHVYSDTSSQHYPNGGDFMRGGRRLDLQNDVSALR